MCRIPYIPMTCVTTYIWDCDSLICYATREINCFKQSIDYYLYLSSNTSHQMKYGIFELCPQISFCRKTRWHCQKFTIIFLRQGVCLVEVKWPIYITKSYTVTKSGCKENHFYSLLFRQAEASIY